MLPNSWRDLRRRKIFSSLFFPYYFLKSQVEICRTPFTKDVFLDRAKAVLHVGGHTGQEIIDYAKRGLEVLWIEANPELFSRLKANLRGFPKQKCLLGLVGSEENQEKTFYISNNDGASSSVFPFEQNETIWPGLAMSKKMLLREITLPSLLQKEKISIHKYDTLILDVQGAELEILKGIPEINKKFTRLQVEACNFPLYKGAPVFEEINNYIKKQNYTLISKDIFAQDFKGRECMNCRYSLL